MALPHRQQFILWNGFVLIKMLATSLSVVVKTLALWLRKMPSPTSRTTASMSIFHRPSLSSPNHDMICVETVRGTSWSFDSAEVRPSTEADACFIESDTSRLRMSSKSRLRYAGVIGLSSSVHALVLAFVHAPRPRDSLLMMRILRSLSPLSSSASLACISALASSYVKRGLGIR